MTPYMPIGQQTVPVELLQLELWEVAPILQITVNDLRNMIRRGELYDISSIRRRRLDPAEVVQLVEAWVAVGKLPHQALIDLADLIRTPRNGGGK